MTNEPPTFNDIKQRFETKDFNAAFGIGKDNLTCDLVMKGGVTSGVVFPWAVCAIAEKYQLKRIGGTSAGAIAAAGSAAAEHGRSTGNNPRSFNQFAKLSSELSMIDQQSKRSKLSRLFQPQPGAEYIFKIVLELIDLLSKGRNPISNALRSKGATRIAYLRFSAVFILQSCTQWFSAVAAMVCLAIFARFVFVVLPNTPDSFLPGLIRFVLGALLTYVCILACCAVATFGDVKRKLSDPERGFGLCTGMETDYLKRIPSNTHTNVAPNLNGEALSRWFDGKLNAWAGNVAPNAPLTFGDLWRGPNPPDADGPGVTLHMMTTCLTLRRPFVIPFEGITPFAEDALYFKPSDLERIVPPSVVQWMVSNWQTQGPVPLDPNLRALLLAGEYVLLPTWDQMPVILGVRMSLSFPTLFTAVRLYRLHKTQAGYDPVEIWFTDGGLSSNFPVHLYDAPIPTRPTFAINLRQYDEPTSRSSNQSENVKIMGSGTLGLEPLRIRGLGSFLSRMFDTLQNWSDNSVLHLDGFYDRICHVNMTADEGGTNLNMPVEIINNLSLRGWHAGDALVQKFTPGHWTDHRWLRYTVTMQNIQKWAKRFEFGWSHNPDILTKLQAKTGLPGAGNTFDAALEFGNKVQGFCNNWNANNFEFYRGELVAPFPPGDPRNLQASKQQFDLKARPRL
jgi:hypothetical protein